MRKYIASAVFASLSLSAHAGSFHLTDGAAKDNRAGKAARRRTGAP